MVLQILDTEILGEKLPKGAHGSALMDYEMNPRRLDATDAILNRRAVDPIG